MSVAKEGESWSLTESRYFGKPCFAQNCEYGTADGSEQGERHFTGIASITDKGGEGHCKGLFNWDQHKAAEDGTADVCAGVVNQGGIIVKLNK